MSKDKKRLDYLDAIAGLLIIRMIFGHLFQCCLLTDTQIYWWMDTVFSFFMPWFFYKSGMLYSPPYQVGNLSSWLSKKRKTLLFPWLWFSIISMVVASIMLLIKGDISIFHHFIVPLKTMLAFGAVSTNLPLWFLLTLFIVHILNFFITKYKINRILIVIVGIILASSLEHIGFKYPATLTSTFLGISFYQLGYLLKDLQFNMKFVLAAGVIGIIPMLLCPSVVDVGTNSIFFGNYYVWYAYSAAAIVLINNLFRVATFYKFPVLRYVGRNAITLLVTHWIVRNILLDLFEVRGYKLFILMCIVMIITLPLLCKIINQDKFKFLIGK